MHGTEDLTCFAATTKKRKAVCKDEVKVRAIKRGKYEYCNAHDDEYKPSYYMQRQKDINPRMRAILVDWLVEVHNSLNLQPAALWLCVNIIDRYLEANQVPRSKLQLVGITALRVASKLDSLNFPLEPEFCVHITAHAFERHEVLDMEKKILKEMEFHYPSTGYHLMMRYLDIINAPEKTRLLTLYYTDRNLQEYDSLSVSPSKFVSAAIFAAIFQQELEKRFTSGRPVNVWPQALAEETGLTEADLMPVACIITKHVADEPITASKRLLNATKKKYAMDKYRQVSKLNVPSLDGNDIYLASALEARK